MSSQVYVHKLDGCSPTPLAHYLKALGVLRLVAEQADATARGGWRNDRFVLVSTLDQAALEVFFLKDYQPTPLLAPWNGGSGFYPKDNKSGIDPIARSSASRFRKYRDAIETCRQIIDGSSAKPDAAGKQALLAACRRQWRGPLADWLDVAVTLAADGSPSYPALLGTGGNDGRLDFTNNFMQRLMELFDAADHQASARPEAEPLLRTALYSSPSPGLGSTAVGQFYPGASGGANSSTGFGSDTLVNPWDYILMLEGSILFASSVTRRSTLGGLPLAAAPFTVRAAATGYGSAADENNRGEQWMPLWPGFARLDEVKGMLGEARCQAGRTAAQRPLETARAIARLGVARGIAEFERYSYVERNGLANLAVPLGRWQVSVQPNQRLIDEITPWFERFERAIDKNTPTSVARSARRCQDAMMACCRDGASPQHWLELLVRLGEAEQQLVRSPKFTGSKRLLPLSGLSPGWLQAGSAMVDRPEFRLALAIAGQHATRFASNSDKLYPDHRRPVRMHWLPLKHAKTGVYTNHQFATSNDQLVNDPDVVCNGLHLTNDLISLVRRRMLQTRGEGSTGYLGLHPTFGTAASLSDVAAWLDGSVNERLIQSLVRPLMALDFEAIGKATAAGDLPDLGHAPSSAYEQRQLAEQLSIYGLFRLCYHSGPLSVFVGTHNDGRPAEPIDIPIKPDARPFTQLMAGNLASGGRSAIARLRSHGLTPHLMQVHGQASLAHRIAASLAIPISTSSARILAESLTTPALDVDEQAISDEAGFDTVPA